MKLAKIVSLNDKVQVVVKKAVIEGEHGITLNYVGWAEDNSIANATLTLKYKLMSSRDKDFDNMSKPIGLRLGRTLPTFKDLLDEES